MAALRAAVDACEACCGSWPVPKYEKLFFDHHTMNSASAAF
jgi:hypothetical protein